MYCMNEEQSQMLACLKQQKSQPNFDQRCMKVIIERQREQMTGEIIFCVQYMEGSVVAIIAVCESQNGLISMSFSVKYTPKPLSLVSPNIF